MELFWENIECSEFTQFPSLDSQHEEIKKYDIITHVNLKNVQNKMEVIFSEILEINVRMGNWK